MFIISNEIVAHKEFHSKYFKLDAKVCKELQIFVYVLPQMKFKFETAPKKEEITKGP